MTLEEWTNSSLEIQQHSYFEESDIGIHHRLSTQDYQPDVIETFDSVSERFVTVFGQNRVEVPIFNQFRILINSQQTNWKQKYGALICFPKFCEHLKKSTTKKISIILHLILNVVEDENIRVVWASLYYLEDLVSQSREKVFSTIARSISALDPNERVQRTCCRFIQSNMPYPKDKSSSVDETAIDTVLKRLCNSFEQLLQSPILTVLENTLLSFISFVETHTITKILRPYFGNIIPILISLVKKHHSTKDSRLLFCRSINAFELSGQVVGKLLQYGERSDKTLDLFDKALHLALLPNHLDDCYALENRIRVGTNIIKVMGNDSMTIDQVRSVLNGLKVFEKTLMDNAQQVREGNQDVINDENPKDILYSIDEGVGGIYKFIGKMLKLNCTITAPLITSSDLLDKACQKLDVIQDGDYFKMDILYFIEQFFDFGGEEAINRFPQLIPPKLEQLPNLERMMEQPDDLEDFIELVVSLAKEDDQQQEKEKKDNNNNILKSQSKQQYKNYSLSNPSKLVSKLIYLIVKVPYPTIKEKAVQLLDRLLVKEGIKFIGDLPKVIVNTVKVEAIELLKTTLTDTFRQHLFSIIEYFANYLVPRCLWDELETTLEYKVNGKEELSTPLRDNTIALQTLLSRYDFKMKKQEMLEESIISDTFLSELSEKQYRSIIPMLLSMLVQIDGLDRGEFIDNSVRNITEIFIHSRSGLRHELIPQINDTLIEVLERNRENGFRNKTIKKNILGCLTVLIGSNSNPTNPHIERIISHLYEWLSDVQDLSLEEWTESSNLNYKFNFHEEREYGLLQKRPIGRKDYQDDDIQAIDRSIARFIGAFGQPVVKTVSILVCNQLIRFSNSQSWKHRYAALICLPKFCKYLQENIENQFPIILKTILKSTKDSNIKVVWASLDCLIQISRQFHQFKELLVKFRGQVCRVIVKLISDYPNQRIQHTCCLFIQSIMQLLKRDVVAYNIDDVLKALSSSFETLLLSPTISVVENSLLSLFTIINSLTFRLKPYFGNILPILLSLLEKYHGTKESRLLRCRVIKAFGLCGKVIDKKTFTRYLYMLMQFVKKNEKSLDLVVIEYIFKESGSFMQLVGNSFAIYLPMIIRMIINILETPILEEEEEDVKSIILTLNNLKDILEWFNGKQKTAYEPLARFSQRLNSLSNLPAVLKLYLLHFGAKSEKTLEMFGKILELALTYCSIQPLHFNILGEFIIMGAKVIKVMGKDSMTLDQIHSTLDRLNVIEKVFSDDRDEDIIGDGLFSTGDSQRSISQGIEGIYMTMGHMLKHNRAITAPLITSDHLDRACQILDGTEDEFSVKQNTHYFMMQYFKCGNENAINSFPKVIPTIVKCMTSDNIMERQFSSIALGVAAQIGKDRFSPWVIDALQALDSIASEPYSEIVYKEIVKQHAISSIVCLSIIMEQPGEGFIEIIVILAKQDQHKQIKRDNNNNNNSREDDLIFDRLYSQTKKQYKEYTLSKPEQVVSWLLFLMVKGTYPTIKDKALQLLYRLFDLFKGQYFIKSLSEEMVDVVKIETIKFLNTTLTETKRFHLFSIIESLAVYLRGLWDELESTLNTFVNEKEEEEESKLRDNTMALLNTFSFTSIQKDKQNMLVDMVESFDFARELTEKQYRSYIPMLLSMMAEMDGSVDGDLLEKCVCNLTRIIFYYNPIWMKDFTVHTIDTLIDVLDRHREKGFETKNNKTVVFRHLLEMASKTPDYFTDSHIERILPHFYEWLSDIEDLSLEECTDKPSMIDIGNIIDNSNDDDNNDDSNSDGGDSNSDSDSEEDDEIITDYYRDYNKNYQLVAAASCFHRFVHTFGQKVAVPIFKHFLIFSNSQQSWKQRYAALMSITKFSKFFKEKIGHREQFPIILKVASFKCLIQLSIDLSDLIVESRYDIFQVIFQLIRDDPYIFIQNSCCWVIHRMMLLLKQDMIDDNALDRLFSSFQIQLESPILSVTMITIQSFMIVVDTVKDRFRPYSQRFIPILLTLLEKHHTEKESFKLCQSTIKAIAICGKVMEKKTFSRYLHKFMMFVKKNEKALGSPIYNVFRASHLFIDAVDKSFSVYLPMIMRMMINELETTPLPDFTELDALGLVEIMGKVEDESLYEPLAPFAHRLVGPLCNLLDAQPNSRDHIQICLLFYCFLVEWEQSHLYTDHIEDGCMVIKAMGKDAMTIDQVQSALDIFDEMDNRLFDRLDHIRDGIQLDNDDDNDDDEDIDEILDTISKSHLLKYNSTISTPLITSSNLLEKCCNKLRDNEVIDDIKTGILELLANYCEYGGDLAINSYPHIITHIIKCLEQQENEMVNDRR
ncbi:hypothetical protein DFA_00486 [Cavenderia fasciculata]|uniref:HEAT repeat-containing protein n=1 Tax=Cavenderia fasciculata TaxID=261658 RepID=F4PS27_CACFS|nr:uncharacterized protein DFA_00486 [Cavenderia fasciculata]EGG20625.1 hypothetical protein DFA_00486 [Cavenderia fasciculata]|eukprot:XP_004358475.1 hypothetical protein DFA_00486 [Cavenderia fasciculata]